MEVYIQTKASALLSKKGKISIEDSQDVTLRKSSLMIDTSNAQHTRDRSISHTFGLGAPKTHDTLPEMEKIEEDFSKDTTKISTFSK